MALLVTLPTPVPQKTTDAVTENNYSFRQSLTAGEAVYLYATNHCRYTSHLSRQQLQPAESSSQQPASQIHPPPTSPFPAAEIAWPYPLSHMAPKFNFDYTNEELWAISDVTFVWLCSLSRGHRASASFSPLSTTHWSEGVSNDFIPQVSLLHWITKALPSAFRIRDRTQNSS